MQHFCAIGIHLLSHWLMSNREHNDNEPGRGGEQDTPQSVTQKGITPLGGGGEPEGVLRMLANWEKRRPPGPAQAPARDPARALARARPGPRPPTRALARALARAHGPGPGPGPWPGLQNLEALQDPQDFYLKKYKVSSQKKPPDAGYQRSPGLL